MSIDPFYLVYGIIFLCVLLLVEGVFYLIADNFGGRRGANRRMRMLSSSTNAREVFTKLRRASRTSWDRLGSVGALLTGFNNLITQSGLTMTTERMFVVMAGLAVAAFFGVVILVARNPSVALGRSMFLVAAVVAVVVGVLGPVLYLLYLRKKRLKLFAEQLPDALDMMVRSLRAGHPVGVAMGLAAKQMPDPIGTEIGIAVDEMTYGLELREALENVGKRVKVQEFEFVVVAISIQHDTGGNLAEVLGGLATVMRGRFLMFTKIKALSAEGRFSSKFLSALPFAFGAMAFSGNPKYYLQVIDEPMFLQVMGLALVLQIIGMIIMRKLINFQV